MNNLKDGLYQSMPMSEYQSLDRCSASRLRDLLRSPAYCKWRIDHPDIEATDAQRFGTATHIAVLQSRIFDETYAVAQPCSAHTKAGKACSNSGKYVRGGDWFCGVHAPKNTSEEEGRIVLTQDEFDRCLRIKDAVWQHPRAATLLSGETIRECSLIWEEPAGGVLFPCKGRPDLLTDKYLVDLKIVRRERPEGIGPILSRYKIHVQMDHYLNGLDILGQSRDAALIICVEPTPPHEVEVYSLSDSTQNAADSERRRLLALYAKCLRDDEWPAYSDKVIEATLPSWELAMALEMEMENTQNGP